MTTRETTRSAQLLAAQASTVDGVLRRTAASRGGDPALDFQDRTWTYAGLDAAVNHVVRRLARAGLAPGDRVAAYGANSDVYVILFLACARSRLVHVPVNFALKGAELAYLLQDSGACLLIADAELLPLAAEVRDGCEDLRGLELWALDVSPEDKTVRGALADLVPLLQTALASGDAGHEAGDEPASPASEDLAQLLYTSGTTSAPKGAMMTHRALVSEYLSAMIALDLAGDDRPLIVMPLYHSAAMHTFLLPYLGLGAHIRLHRRPDVAAILETIESQRITSLFLAPTVWVPLSNHPDLTTRDLTSLVKAQYGASIMPTTVLARLRERFPRIGFYNCFGQSELGPLCTVLRPEEHDARPSSCGRPVPLVEARVVDPAGQPVPDGEPGEIQYRSPQLMEGYWNKPEATEEAFMDGWFRSGDQVRRDSRGYLEVVDRIKDVINTGGVLVASRDVEDCIYTLDEVAEVAVIGLPDERWIEAITAVVVLKEGAQLTSEQVRAHVDAHLAHYKVPKRVEFVAELPRNQSGKLLKRQLRAERTDGATA